MKILISLLIILFSIGCSNNDSEKFAKPKSETRQQRPLRPNVCEFDSLILYRIDSIMPGGKIIYDAKAYYFDSTSLKQIQPFLTDSMKNKYSCCPTNDFGKIASFSNGKICTDLMIVTNGGPVGNEFDTSAIFLYSVGYQYRTKIPKHIWKTTLQHLERTN